MEVEISHTEIARLREIISLMSLKEKSFGDLDTQARTFASKRATHKSVSHQISYQPYYTDLIKQLQSLPEFTHLIATSTRGAEGAGQREVLAHAKQFLISVTEVVKERYEDKEKYQSLLRKYYELLNQEVRTTQNKGFLKGSEEVEEVDGDELLIEDVEEERKSDPRGQSSGGYPRKPRQTSAIYSAETSKPRRCE